MKTALLALSLSLGVLLTGCTGVRVANVEVASGETAPKAIYIRPFEMNYAAYRDGNNPNGLVRASLVPVAFADMLQTELGKLAPTTVLKDHEDAPTGWLVEGQIERLDTYSPTAMRIHVRVTDVGDCPVAFSPTKAGVSTYEVIPMPNGSIVYEFDLKGGRLAKAPFNDTVTRADREGVYFDLRNAAERMMLALSPDPFRYGYRGTPQQRN